MATTTRTELVESLFDKCSRGCCLVLNLDRLAAVVLTEEELAGLEEHVIEAQKYEQWERAQLHDFRECWLCAQNYSKAELASFYGDGFDDVHDMQENRDMHEHEEN